MWTIFYGWSEWEGLQEEVQLDYLLLWVALFDTSKYIYNEFKLTDCHLQIVFNANGFSCITWVLAQFQFHCRKIKGKICWFPFKARWSATEGLSTITTTTGSHEWKTVYCAPKAHYPYNYVWPASPLTGILWWISICHRYRHHKNTSVTFRLPLELLYQRKWIESCRSNIIVMEMIVNLSSVSTSLSSH